MNKITKGVALTLATVLMSGTGACAAGWFPVREALEKKGFEIGWNQEEKSIIIRDGGFVLEEKVGKNVRLDYDKTYAEEGFFAEVDAMKKAYEEYSTKATVKEVGEGYFIAETEKLGEVMFMVDDNTYFCHEMNRRLYRFDDVTVGAEVKVYFSEAMTASLPPQTYAKEVVFLNEAQIEQKTFVTGTVTEVGEGFILAETETMGEVMFMVSEETNIHHEMNRRLYTIADIEVGMKINVNHAEAMTASLPPQVAAYEVIIMNADGKLAVSENSQVFKVSEVGEGYILASNEKMGEVMFKVDEKTTFRHEMNSYTLSDVTAGINLQITFDEAMTASLPPQVYASDVVFVTTEEIVVENVTTSGEIVAIGEDFFTIEKEDGSRVRFNVSEETFFHHVMNRMLYRFDSLEEGMEVDVIHADAMTFSLPPQAGAIEVIIK